MPSGKGKIVLMGSGEFTATMVEDTEEGSRWQTAFKP